MTTTTTPMYRTEKQIIADLVRVRKRIRELRKAYERQNELYIEGYESGMKISHLAAAGGPEYAVGDQAVRDVLRRHGIT